MAKAGWTLTTLSFVWLALSGELDWLAVLVPVAAALAYGAATLGNKKSTDWRARNGVA